MTGIFLARRAGPETYGAYMLLFAAFLLIANAHQALLLEPANVLAFSLFPGRNDRYLRVVLRLHGVFTAAFLALGGAALWLAPRLGMKTLLVNALSGMVIAVPCVLLFWLARAFAYLEFAPAAAVRGSAVYGGVLLVSILGVARLRGLTPESGYCCVAAASLAASLRLLVTRLPWGHADAGEPGTGQVWARHWNFGRWGLGTVGLSWAQTNSISFISGSLLGLRDVGGLNALVALLLPMLQVLNSAARLALPRIAQIYTLHGAGATRRPVIRVAFVLVTLTAAYALAISALRGTIFHHLYGERFMAYAWLVPLMGVHLVACGGIAACDIGFNSIQAPHASFPIKLLLVAGDDSGEHGAYLAVRPARGGPRRFRVQQPHGDPAGPQAAGCVAGRSAFASGWRMLGRRPRRRAPANGFPDAARQSADCPGVVQQRPSGGRHGADRAEPGQRAGGEGLAHGASRPLRAHRISAPRHPAGSGIRRITTRAARPRHCSTRCAFSGGRWRNYGVQVVSAHGSVFPLLASGVPVVWTEHDVRYAGAEMLRGLRGLCLAAGAGALASGAAGGWLRCRTTCSARSAGS